VSYELCWRYPPKRDWHPPRDSESVQHGLWIPATSYFTIALGPMSELLDLMIEREMLGLGDAPIEPEPESFGISNPPYPGSTNFAQHPDPLLESYEEAWWAVRMTRLAEPGIALYKLCSNEHWWVRPDEINEALSLASGSPDPAFRLWKDWLAYLHGAANHGGFTVL
jgi:hypothetical protein